MIKILFSLLVLTSPTKKVSSDWQTLDVANYSIRYPSDWELNQEGMMGSEFILFAPLESRKDKFKENVNLIIQDLAGTGIDMNQYQKLSEEQVRTLVTNSNLLQSNRIIAGEDQYHYISYTGDSGNFHLNFEQYYWIRNEKAYILTFTCEQSIYEQYKETAIKIMNSFVLKK